MTFVPLCEREEFKRGRTGERLVAAALQERGWLVLPSYDYSGKDDQAPAAPPPRERYLVLLEALPDDAPAVIRLRRFLKAALRSYGLKAVRVTEAGREGGPGGGAVE